MNKIECLDCCHCAQCAFTGEFECERDMEGFPEKCEQFEECYKGAKCD